MRSIAMSVSVCLSVRWHISKTTVQTSRNFLYFLAVAAARSSSDDNRIRRVLPVLWMTSCFPTMGPVACGDANVYVSDVPEQIVINFQRIPQVAAHCLILSSYTMAANCTPGSKSAVYDALFSSASEVFDILALYKSDYYYY